MDDSIAVNVLFHHNAALCGNAAPIILSLLCALHVERIRHVHCFTDVQVPGHPNTSVGDNAPRI